MLAALAEHFPAAATWTEPEGGLFIWATLPEYIDTEDLLAKALRSDVAFVPGAAAYVDGRGEELDAAELQRRERRGNPRGHHAGSARVIREQVELYETLAPLPGTPRPRRARHARTRSGGRAG